MNHSPKGSGQARQYDIPTQSDKLDSIHGQNPDILFCELEEISEKDRTRVGRLLASFGATALGEGDPISGANTLAVMACSLANLEKPGSGLIDAEGKSLEVGSSLVISGSHSVALIRERALRPIERKQRNLISHLESYAEWCSPQPREREADRIGRTSEEGPWAVSGSLVSDFLHSPVFSGGIDKRQFLSLTRPAKPSFRRDLHFRPFVYLNAGIHDQVVQSLRRCHHGYPFVHFGLGHGAELAKLAGICATVMNGRMCNGEDSGSGRGHIFVTDPVCGLDELTRDDKPSANLYARMPWLTESGAGPECAEAGAHITRLGVIHELYERAMDEAWYRRLDLSATGTNQMRISSLDFQSRWISFLQSYESTFPGISYAARSFLATLIFGFGMLLKIARNSEFILSIPEVSAFARYLILRMINARTSMLHAGEGARLASVAFKISIKLDGQPPMSVREITRKFNRLSSTDCFEALSLLNKAGRVAPVGEKWALISQEPNEGKVSPTINV